MNICLLGATGRVGSVILENALRDNHSIQALVRDPKKLLIKSQNLHIIKGNALNRQNISEAICGSDVVVSALNTDKNTLLSESMPIIIEQMRIQQIRRIITIGTAGILQARSEPNLYRFQSSESKRKTTKDAEEHLKAFLHLKESGLDWTVVCPTYLPLGKRIGTYRYEKNIIPENPFSISVYDSGDFAYNQLFSDQFVGCRVGLTY
ncbi:MAG TPA: NAD(P)H-binding protein [Bacillales bacterium]|nr:NAD(P)H-binding protein [Bacillales bacterium]